MALTDNLISYWELEEGIGTRVDAVVATGNDLTDHNTVDVSGGVVGSCAQFVTANSEYLSRASNASLQTGDIDYSFVAWVKRLAGGDQYYLSKTGATEGEYFLYYFDGSERFRFIAFGPSYGDIGGLAQADTFGATSGNTWYMLFCCHDSVNNVTKISVNAGAMDSTPTTGAAAATNDAFEMGARTIVTGYMTGNIDQVGFWKRVLSPAEVTQLYNGGAGMSYAALAAAPANVALTRFTASPARWR